MSTYSFQRTVMRSRIIECERVSCHKERDGWKVCVLKSSWPTPSSFSGSIARGLLSVSSCLFPGRSSNTSALEKWNVSASQEHDSSTLHAAAERGLLSHTPKQVAKEILYSQQLRKKKKILELSLIGFTCVACYFWINHCDQGELTRWLNGPGFYREGQRKNELCYKKRIHGFWGGNNLSSPSLPG